MYGCIYYNSRSKYYQIHHDVEDIEVKINAPKVLEDALRRKRKKCMISTGAMSDPYNHLEERLGYTRKCIELIYSYGFGLAMQTKFAVQMTLTTYDKTFSKIIESMY